MEVFVPELNKFVTAPDDITGEELRAALQQPIDDATITIPEGIGRAAVRGAVGIGKAATTLGEVVTGGAEPFRQASEKLSQVEQAYAPAPIERESVLQRFQEDGLLEAAKLAATPSRLLPQLTEAGVSLLPSVLAAFASGGTSAALGAAPKVAQFVGLIGGGLAGGALEGAQTYQQVLEQGGTESSARNAYLEMTAASAGLNAVSLGGMFAPLAKGGGLAKLGRALLSGSVEGVTEALEEPAEAAILSSEGQPVDWKQVAQRMVDVAIPSSLLGGGVAATEAQLTPGEKPALDRQRNALVGKLIEMQEGVEKGDITYEQAIETLRTVPGVPLTELDQKVLTEFARTRKGTPERVFDLFAERGGSVSKQDVRFVASLMRMKDTKASRVFTDETKVEHQLRTRGLQIEGEDYVSYFNEENLKKLSVLMPEASPQHVAFTGLLLEHMARNALYGKNMTPDQLFTAALAGIEKGDVESEEGLKQTRRAREMMPKTQVMGPSVLRIGKHLAGRRVQATGAFLDYLEARRNREAYNTLSDNTFWEDAYTNLRDGTTQDMTNLDWEQIFSNGGTGILDTQHFLLDLNIPAEEKLWLSERFPIRVAHATPREHAYGIVRPELFNQGATGDAYRSVFTTESAPEADFYFEHHIWHPAVLSSKYATFKEAVAKIEADLTPYQGAGVYAYFSLDPTPSVTLDPGMEARESILRNTLQDKLHELLATYQEEKENQGYDTSTFNFALSQGNTAILKLPGATEVEIQRILTELDKAAREKGFILDDYESQYGFLSEHFISDPVANLDADEEFFKDRAGAYLSRYGEAGRHLIMRDPRNIRAFYLNIEHPLNLDKVWTWFRPGWEQDGLGYSIRPETPPDSRKMSQYARALYEFQLENKYYVDQSGTKFTIGDSEREYYARLSEEEKQLAFSANIDTPVGIRRALADAYTVSYVGGITGDKYRNFLSELTFAQKEGAVSSYRGRRSATDFLESLGIDGLTHASKQTTYAGRKWIAFRSEQVMTTWMADVGVNSFERGKERAEEEGMWPLRQGAKGEIVPVKDAGKIKYLIRALQSSDFSTSLHEFTHFLVLTAQEGTRFKSLIAEQAKTDPSKWSVEQHERFAVGFESWLLNGEPKGGKYSKVFSLVKREMQRVYYGVLKDDIPMSDEFRLSYELLLYGPDVLQEKSTLSAAVIDSLLKYGLPARVARGELGEKKKKEKKAATKNAFVKKQVEAQPAPVPTPEEVEAKTAELMEKITGEPAVPRDFKDRFPIGSKVVYHDPLVLDRSKPKKSSGTVTGYKVDPVTGDLFAEINGGRDYAGDVSDLELAKPPTLQQKAYRRVSPETVPWEGFYRDLTHQSAKLVNDRPAILAILNRAEAGGKIAPDEFAALQDINIAIATVEAMGEKAGANIEEMAALYSDIGSRVQQVARRSASYFGLMLNIQGRAVQMENAMRALAEMGDRMSDADLKLMQSAIEAENWSLVDNIVRNQGWSAKTKSIVMSLFYSGSLWNPGTQIGNPIWNTLWGTYLYGVHIPIRNSIDRVASIIWPGYTRQHYGGEYMQTLAALVNRRTWSKAAGDYAKAIKDPTGLAVQDILTKWDEDAGFDSLHTALEGAIGRVPTRALTFSLANLKAQDLFFKAIAEDVFMRQQQSNWRKAKEAGPAQANAWLLQFVKQNLREIRLPRSKGAQARNMAKNIFVTVGGEQVSLDRAGFRFSDNVGRNEKGRMKVTDADILSDPEAWQTAAALNGRALYAEHSTFQDASGPFVQAFAKMLHSPAFLGLGRVFVPYIHTLATVAKRGMELTPGLGIPAGLVNKLHPTEIVAKQIEGLVLALGVYSLMQVGKITGAPPDDPAEKEAFYRSGKIPYAVNIHGMWFDYSRMDPFGLPLGMMTTLWNEYEAILRDNSNPALQQKTLLDHMVRLSVAARNYFIESQWMRGFAVALQGDEYDVKRQLTYSSTSLVPFSGFWRSMNNAYEAGETGQVALRDRTYLETFGQTLPTPVLRALIDNEIITESPARLDAFGQPKGRRSSFFKEWIPYRYQAQIADPVENEFQALGYYPGMPGQIVTVNKREGRVRMPDDAYNAYLLSYGTAAKERLINLMSRPSYSTMRKEVKVKLIQDALESVRSRELKRIKLRIRRGEFAL